MDGPDFDRITRSWARRTNRRGALRGLAAGLLTGWGWRRSGGAAVAQEGPAAITCTQDAECLDGDLDPCTGATCVDGSCTYFIVDCIPGHVCCDNGACCPSEEPGICLTDADCMPTSGDPCEGTLCEGGVCVSFLVSCAADHACCGNGACCPTGEPGACLADTDCLHESGDPCEGVRCEGGTCVPFLVSCAPDFVCCGNGTCCPVNGCANDTDCAAIAGGPCARTRCISGVCVPGSTPV